MNAITTLTGLPLEEVRARLDAELPPDAYSKVPGAIDLTDIDPAYMRHVLNEVFGLCGYGWGYSYNVADLDITYGEKQVTALCRHLVFWFKLVEGDQVQCLEIPATGANENRVPQYAMKGALTNALGNAVSNIGFQESVYMGRRSHTTVSRKAATARPAPAKPTPPPAPKKAVNGHTNGASVNAVQPGDFIIEVGTQFKGKAVKDLPPKALVWFAESMAATNPTARATKDACTAFLALHPELRAAVGNGAVATA